MLLIVRDLPKLVAVILLSVSLTFLFIIEVKACLQRKEKVTTI